ncbi:hypothetical protein [Streptomyces sp. NBC_00453]|uniref:hypothetical protein n=1 Tax=Streptomyces sp. NBC_00453 TaxID=2903653 RepID=UPI002E1EFF08
MSVEEEAAVQAVETPTADAVTVEHEAHTTHVIVDPNPFFGQFWQPITDRLITRNSTVVASITEIGFDAIGAHPIKGFARLQVSNVVPRDGGVDLWVNIGWNSKLAFRILYQVS